MDRASIFQISNQICSSIPRKRLNRSGLKITLFFFPILLKMMAGILKFADSQLFTKASKSMNITNTNLLLVLITVVISELESNRKNIHAY